MAVATSTSSWILRFRRNPAADLRLFCFPYAGGAASIFRTWPSGLPGSIDVAAVQLPGRETRLAEPPVRRLDALVAAMAPALEPFLDRPFALFGHSMGALIAF